MQFKYRNQRNAEATAKFWNKPLDKTEWYEIKAQSGDSAEILIYDYIGWPYNDAGEFVRALAEIDSKAITVRINSPGGDVFDGLAIYNALTSHKSKIITRIESLAASAASFIALAGKEKQAYKNAMIMIHNSLVFTAGNQYDLREIADILEKIDGNMVDIYAQNTSVGKREVRDMMKAETWFTAKEAKDKGFIDTIIDGKAAKAAFDLSMFANTPDEFIANAINAGRDLTRKETERALRNAGASRDYARAVAAKGAAVSDIEMVTEILKLKMTIGGK